MPSAEQLAAVRGPMKVLLMGYPTTGKTGSLVSLANAGFKLRVIDFDGNWQPLVEYTSPEARKNIDIVTLEDNIKPLAPDAAGAAGYSLIGGANAYSRATRLIDHWKYKDAISGEEIDLGKPREWGADTIIVIDSLSGFARSLIRWYLGLTGKPELGPKDWGKLQAMMEGFLEGLTSGTFFSCHVVVTAHFRLTGPDTMDFTDTRKMGQENPAFLEAKRDAAEAIPVRLVPVTVGRQLSTTVTQHFGLVLMTETQLAGGKAKKVIRTQPPGEYIDLRVPAGKLPAELPVESGLLTIFRAMGVPDPVVKKT